MNIGKVQEYKIEIGEEILTFRFDFEALCKFEDKYDNSLEIVNEYLQQKKQYSNLIKILSCCCVEKDLTEEELKKAISLDFPTIKLLDVIGYQMLVGSLDLDKKDENKKETKSKKN
ncbi:hypothetical protein SAMN02745134_00794 [Clostridium acidisoli DSM 12555]|uniref:Phage tail assembly chaperone protein, TAC n=1 Tax=Clostridium acidisoli DSM 12555 TaxID=1121291 RepID=A0A1W1X627_9CLOT|nr:hypothetical protein [Clostridium acidisoli]SMC19300.1 hypothetical protein SAMN02745134_00794 [Clostridium acidisoli DSM 12555]